MQNHLRRRSQGPLQEGQGSSLRRVQCSTSTRTSHHLRRRPWPVLGSSLTPTEGRTHPRWTLHLFGRFCRPRLQFSRNHPSSLFVQTKVSRNSRPAERQPLIPQHHLRLWLLRRNRQKVRQSQRLELFQWCFRLSTSRSRHRRANLLCSRRAVP